MVNDSQLDCFPVFVHTVIAGNRTCLASVVMCPVFEVKVVVLCYDLLLHIQSCHSLWKVAHWSVDYCFLDIEEQVWNCF